ncbi:hypothetical protein BDP27DRAFT_1364078 [Rhodocollybia butyracea]|uniref:Uncharacterized protein n=1 Tax=Rhodocollybia butyracea TaxID=206335 RepID=A0A9P5U825_9AGAR|nr:hypothetical protein BDP27DRAFT_1364078 [Rhodocollybia butyracea]
MFTTTMISEDKENTDQTTGINLTELEQKPRRKPGKLATRQIPTIPSIPPYMRPHLRVLEPRLTDELREILEETEAEYMHYVETHQDQVRWQLDYDNCCLEARSGITATYELLRYIQCQPEAENYGRSDIVCEADGRVIKREDDVDANAGSSNPSIFHSENSLVFLPVPERFKLPSEFFPTWHNPIADNLPLNSTFHSSTSFSTPPPHFGTSSRMSRNLYAKHGARDYAASHATTLHHMPN